MPQTPDRFPGTREEEAIDFDTSSSTLPAIDGEVRYVSGAGWRFLEQGILKSLGVQDADYRLVTEPVREVTYSRTIVGGKTTQEKWELTASSTQVKTIDYTYSGSKVTTEVRKVYADDGSTIQGQLTLSYIYSGSAVSSIGYVRNV
jgi:hypothetical protein